MTRAQVWLCTLLATGQEYAIKRIDKAHLKRHQKEQTALAEKNTLVRLGSGHPGIVRLHWTFQDEWSLCEFAFIIRTCLRAVWGDGRA